METLIKADIFFFITAITVVMISILFLVVLYYAIVFLKRLRVLLDKIEENINTVNLEVKEITAQIKESFLFNLFFGKKSKRK